MNVHELSKKMMDAKAECDASITAYREAVLADANADDVKRRAMAREWVKVREDAPKATVGYIEALVDEETSSEQKAARLADGYKRAAAMRVEAARQWLSSLQSLAAAQRAETELAKWEPRETSVA